MRTLYELIFLAALSLLVSVVNRDVKAQDSLLMLDGYWFTGELIQSDDFIQVKYIKRGKEKYRIFDREEVFSIRPSNGNELIIYKIDSVNDFLFSEQQMREYIAGIQYARECYHPRWVTLGGAATGVAGGTIGFWGLVVPGAYTAISGLASPPLRASKCEDIMIQYPDSEYFLLGFQDEARKKKTLNAFLAGLSGFVSIMALGAVL